MSDIAPKDPFLTRTLSRRGFLKEVGATAGSIILFGGCTTDKKPQPTPPIQYPQPTVRTTEVAPGLPPLTESEVKEVAKTSIKDVNRVLGLQISEDDAVANVLLVPTLEEYQKIWIADGASFPENRLPSEALTTHVYNPNGKKIFLSRPIIDQITKALPSSNEGKNARQEHLEFILDHEFIHWSANSYTSQEIYDVLFRNMFVNHRDYKGKDIKNLGIQGTQVVVEIDGKKIPFFGNLEETEAILISRYVFTNPKIGTTRQLQGTEEGKYANQINMLRTLLGRVYPDLTEGIKTLAQLRTEKGGREKFCRQIAQFYKVQPELQLYFGLSLLYTIDTGDTNTYQQLLSAAEAQRR